MIPVDDPLIVFLDRATLGPDVALRRPTVSHRWVEYALTSPAKRLERLAGACVAITNKVRIGEDELSRLPSLRGIAVAATGVDVIDLAACRARGVTVCNVRDYAATSVAEHVIATLLGLRRNLRGYGQDIEAGRWQASGQFCFFNEPVLDIQGTTLGVIGTGSIAREVSMLARGLGMDVLFCARTRREIDGKSTVELAELLARSDAVTCHCPLNDTTMGLIGTDALDQMRPHAILINTSRGAIVDLLALESALDEGRIAGAAIDVAPEEPPAPDAPIMRLAQRRNVIVTPHSAWASRHCRQALADQLARVVNSLLADKPLNAVSD